MIRYLHVKGSSPTKRHAEISSDYGKHGMNKRQVKRAVRSLPPSSRGLNDLWGIKDARASTYLHSSLSSAFRRASPNPNPVHSGIIPVPLSVCLSFFDYCINPIQGNLESPLMRCSRRRRSALRIGLVSWDPSPPPGAQCGFRTPDLYF